MMVKKVLAIAATVALAGCMTEPKVESTQPWENHYMTIEQFKEGTKDITLGEGESIWVLSNQTLKRLLLNIK